VNPLLECRKAEKSERSDDEDDKKRQRLEHEEKARNLTMLLVRTVGASHKKVMWWN